jgi:hypothetical protein
MTQLKFVKIMETLIEDSALLRKLEFDAAITNDDILTDQEKNRARILISDTERLLSSLDQEIGPLTGSKGA